MSKRRAGQLLSILAVALLLTGCGSSSSGNTPTSASTSGGNGAPSSGTTTTTAGTGPGTGGSAGSWTEKSVANAGSLNAVSCSSASDCVAVGTDAGKAQDGAIWTSNNGGSTWTEDVVGNASTGPDSVSCSSSSDCVAVGGANPGQGDDWVTTDGGTTWTEHVVPSADTTQPTVGGFTDVSCVSAHVCVAAGADSYGNGASWMTTDGGAKWTQRPVPDTSNSTASNGGPVAISCSTNNFCVTVGTNNNGDSVAWTSLNSGQWNQQPIPGAEAPNGDVQDISCAPVSDCVAVGEDGTGNGNPAVWTTSNEGSAWTEQTVPNSGGSNSYLRWVSCPSTTVCVAVGNDTNDEDAWSTADGGTSWTEQPIPDIDTSNGTLSDISCGSASQCVAIGTDSSGAASAWVGPA
jgi:hypothetical protein